MNQRFSKSFLANIFNGSFIPQKVSRKTDSFSKKWKFLKFSSCNSRTLEPYQTSPLWLVDRDFAELRFEILIFWGYDSDFLKWEIARYFFPQQKFSTQRKLAGSLASKDYTTFSPIQILNLFSVSSFSVFFQYFEYALQNYGWKFSVF